MEGLPSVIPKSIVEVLYWLENDEDNLFSWKLTRSQDSFSLTASCKLRAKTPNKAKGDRSPSVVACSRKRHTRFLEKKLAGKPDLASPEEDQQDSDNSVCVKELEKPVLLVVVTGTWCLRKIQHQAQLILTCCR